MTNTQGIKINHRDLDKTRTMAGDKINSTLEVAPSLSVLNRIEEIFGQDALVFKNPVETTSGERRKKESCYIGETLVNLRKQFLTNSVIAPPSMALSSFVLQEAIAFGGHMNDEQKKLFMIDGNNGSSIEGYDDKRMSASTIGLFSMASYAIYLIDQTPKITEINFSSEFPGIPELPVDTFNGGVNCVLYYLNLYLKRKNYINSEGELLGFLRLYFSEVQKETAGRKDNLQADNIFEKNTYIMEVPKYTVPFSMSGWSINTEKAVERKTFRRQDVSTMVGNEEELALLQRLAFMVCSYKPEIQQNVWNRFGKVQNFLAFYGKPGCGKTMLARILATLIYDLCVLIGKEANFNFDELDPTIKDKYVGETAKKVEAKLASFSDLKKISLLLVDDAEALLQDMADDNDGSKDVTSKFLNFTDGASSKFQDIFNCIIFVGTNNYNVFSPPIKSRFSLSREIEGPKKASDFTSIAKFTLDKFKEYGGILSTSKNPDVGKKKIYHAQEIDYTDIKQLNLESELYNLHVELAKKFEGEDLIGEVFSTTKEKLCPSLSGRTMENVMKAVTAVMNAFPIPDNASKDPTVFFDKSIDEQEQMIIGWKKDYVQKINYPAMVIYTMLKFINDELKTTKFSDQKTIDKIVENDRISKKAQKAIEEQTK